MEYAQDTQYTVPQKMLTGRRGGVGTGTTSLLMIFTVLCFATLAMLSLSTAASGRRIQQRGVFSAAAAAAARGNAAEEVAKLDAGLLMLRQTGGGQADYVNAATLFAEGLGWQRGEEDGVISLVLPADDANQLVTELRLLPQGEALRYTVIRQALRMAGGWQPEDGAGLWMP